MCGDVSAAGDKSLLVNPTAEATAPVVSGFAVLADLEAVFRIANAPENIQAGEGDDGDGCVTGSGL
jgi:hypothetical protein